MQNRKLDTREKIQLGGLVVKAGLRDLDKATILGALLDLSDFVNSGNHEALNRFKKMGEVAFKEKDAQTPS